MRLTPRAFIVRRWLTAWLQVAEGVCTIITLGIIDISWTYNLSHYLLKKDYKAGKLKTSSELNK